MEKINLSELSITDLMNLEHACMLLYNKNQNEYIAFRAQYTPKGLELHRELLEEMERNSKRYNDIHNKVLAEIDLRLDSIYDE